MFSVAKAAVRGKAATQVTIGAGAGAIYGGAQGYDAGSRLEGAAKGALLGGIAAGTFAGLQRAAMPAAKKSGSWLTNTKGFARRRAIMNPVGPKMESGQFYTSMPVGWGKEMSLTHQLQQTGVAKLARGGTKLATKAGSTGIRLANFAAEHPALVAGTIGAAVGGAALVRGVGVGRGELQPMESPTLEGAEVNTRYDQQVAAAQQMGQIGGGQLGAAPQMREQFEYANWMSQVGQIAAGTPGGRMAQSAHGLVQGLHSGRHG